ncbi:MAG: hypothetical protein KBH07_00030 [Flavobacteriales bacterium]|nr:hypothetical protein [Flavobacteriales bacterium]MBP9079106.1 hypothetical protein [Flavobacteriales bacterium]
MSHTGSDHLHRLVHAMTRAEKRYFKLYTSRHPLPGTSVQQALFDAIAALPAYDQAALERQFHGQPFMRRFAVTKRRLYEAVLESLDAYHANNSVDDQLRRQLHHVEVLHNKALHADAAKMLRSVRTHASQYGKHALLLQVAEWERRIWERANYTDISPLDLEERAKGTGELAAAWVEVDQLWQLKSEVFLVLYRCGQAPGMRELEELNALACSPLLAQGTHARSAYAHFLQHHVRSALAYARNDLQACEAHLEACAQHVRTEADAFKGEPGLMLGVLGNLAQVRLRLGRHQEALDGFRAFRKVPLMMAKAPDPDLEMKLFVMAGSLQLAVYTVQGEHIRAMEEVQCLEAGMARFGERLSPVRRAELALQAAYVALGAGQADQALRWCNRLLNEKGIAAHVELHALGRMVNVMCLVELGKHDLLAYLVRNAQRALKQHGSPYAMERILLAHAHALAACTGQPRKPGSWPTLLAELEQAATDPKEAALLDQIDLVAWCRANTEGRAFHVLLRERWLAATAAGGTLPKNCGRNKAA